MKQIISTFKILFKKDSNKTKDNSKSSSSFDFSNVENDIKEGVETSKRYMKKGLIVLLLLMAIPYVGFWAYYLPSYDVVRIVDTDVKRMDAKGNLITEDNRGAKVGDETRDVRFINSVWPDGKPRVYRNEETGWGFPWYLKFDSQNVTTKAQDLRSVSDDPTWVVIKHYGWRFEILSMFPNAVNVSKVENNDINNINKIWFYIIPCSIFLMFHLIVLTFITLFVKVIRR